MDRRRVHLALALGLLVGLAWYRRRRIEAAEQALGIGSGRIGPG